MIRYYLYLNKTKIFTKFLENNGKRKKLFSQLNLYYVVQKCLDKDVKMKCTVERVGASAVFLS